MSHSKFIGILRKLGIGLGLVGMASLCATTASAQDVAPVNTMDVAPQIIAAAKINCEPVNARLVGPTDVDGPNATKIKANLHEIACKTGPGFIITVVSPTEAKAPFTCIYLRELKKKDPKLPVCTLPENVPDYKWLAPVAKTFLPTCELSGARMVGSTSTEPLIDRFEIGCTGAAGGLIDYPQLGTSSAPEYKNCLTFAESVSKCIYTTKAQIIESLKPLAAAAKPDCQIADVRFVGITNDNDGSYYEFGCTGAPGFIVLAKNDGSYSRTIACASAMGLGGCKFTDAGAAAADANAYMTQTLQAAGKTCTVTDYRVIGTQESSKRDYAEFKCAEQPWGLIGFVPQPGTDGQTRVNDCFLDQVGRKSCTYVTTDTLMAQLDKLIKVAQPTKGCDVKEVRYMGESGAVEDGVLAELACVNKRGYIVIVSADRQSLIESIPCTVAKSQKLEEQCQIAENGTYSSVE